MTGTAAPGRPARAYWTTGPRRGELREARLPAPTAGEALVRALASGISRGTELLVHRGQVPGSIAQAMRAPFQEGDFPYPVKYGYLSVGEVEQGPPDLVGRRVFALHPHQDRYVLPVEALQPVPDQVPTERAVLAGAVETGVNALWDAPPLIGDRVAVVGSGMIGSCLARLLTRFPVERLQLVDPDPRLEPLAESIGVQLVHPHDAAAGCDSVYHCSGTADGLARSLALLGTEGEVVELSWYGESAPAVPLGAEFHARRLTIKGSQVGRVAPARRSRRSAGDRLALALAALADPAFDALITGRSDFADLPTTMGRLDAGDLPGGCHVVTYR